MTRGKPGRFIAENAGLFEIGAAREGSGQRAGGQLQFADPQDAAARVTETHFSSSLVPGLHEVLSRLTSRVRVTKPGGRIVMGNWMPNDPTFVSQVLKVSPAFTPPPPEGFVNPMTWGVESDVVERFGQTGVPQEKISMVKDTFHFKLPDHGPVEFIDLFRRFYGPTMNAFDSAEKLGKVEELHSQFVELAKAQNRSENGTSIPATYLRVTVSI